MAASEHTVAQSYELGNSTYECPILSLCNFLISKRLKLKHTVYYAYSKKSCKTFFLTNQKQIFAVQATNYPITHAQG